MTKIAINELTTYRWSFEEDVTYFSKAGVDGIGVWRQKLSDYGEEKGAELLAECGLAVSSLLWVGGFTGSDGRSFDDAVEDAREAIHLAASLNAASLIIYSGARARHTNNHARRLFRGALNSLLPIAAKYGVTLAIEPTHPAAPGDFTFLTSLDEVVALLDEFDSPYLKLAFDTYHLGHDALSFDQLTRLAPRVAIVQLGDAAGPPNGDPERCLLGNGTIPLEPLVGGLLAGGYDGFFEVELMGPEVESTEYGELVKLSVAAARDVVSGHGSART
ncbi:MAG: sugar phosphate isomerase/epimerase [Pirellulaceae bacterium]|nr:sugar phosphate isomerase/epimerase [Pirellulaceae bacterium]